MKPHEADQVMRGDNVTWHNGQKQCYGIMVRRCTYQFAPAFSIRSVNGLHTIIVPVSIIEMG